MRLKLAKIRNIALALAMVGLASTSASAQNVGDTIQTIEGECYVSIKVLKVESDGVTVKHSRGIAKIPYYELNEETRKKYGHVGELEAPIRRKPSPSAGLLGSDLTGDDLELDALDLDSAKQKDDEAAAAKLAPPKVKQATSKAQLERKSQPAPVVRRRPAVKVNAIGMSTWLKSNRTERYPGSHRRTCDCGGAHAAPSGTVTTHYTPYGNYSHAGGPRFPYGYYNPPSNRCHFERTDFRRWENGK